MAGRGDSRVRHNYHGGPPRKRRTFGERRRGIMRDMTLPQVRAPEGPAAAPPAVGDLGDLGRPGGPGRTDGDRDREWGGRAAAITAVLLPTAVAAAVAGRAAGILAFATVGLLLQAVRFLLPGWAHAAFVRGDLTAAHRRYRALAKLAWLRQRRIHAELSLAAVALARGDHAAAEGYLARCSVDELDADARAAWLNNRAYARLRQGQGLDEALELAQAAVALRPDVPGIRHTHGLALLAHGKVDAAIKALDELHRMAELPAPLEAERCEDLAEAWSRKGETAYAAEYRARAVGARHRRGT
ncbi:MAG: tetratricopeptide repeat protein [Myxococcales bacterium]|nr:tetratricopeptide repeat protein [Myxococcales bacterium]